MNEGTREDVDVWGRGCGDMMSTQRDVKRRKKQDDKSKERRPLPSLRFAVLSFLLLSSPPLYVHNCNPPHPHHRKPSQTPIPLISSSSAARASPPPSWWAGCPADTSGRGGSPAKSRGRSCTRTTPCAQSWSCLWCRGVGFMGHGVRWLAGIHFKSHACIETRGTRARTVGVVRRHCLPNQRLSEDLGTCGSSVSCTVQGKSGWSAGHSYGLQSQVASTCDDDNDKDNAPLGPCENGRFPKMRRAASCCVYMIYGAICGQHRQSDIHTWACVPIRTNKAGTRHSFTPNRPSGPPPPLPQEIRVLLFLPWAACWCGCCSRSSKPEC